VLGEAFTSPVGIALQVVMLLALVALLRVDWSSRLARRRAGGRRSPRPPLVGSR
jgi:hypothetical protein